MLIFQCHKSAWPFIDPVDASEVPDYYDIIKEPMGRLWIAELLKNALWTFLDFLFAADLKQIESRIITRAYSCLADFIKDMTKIFDNCRFYNQRDSTFYKSAEDLEAFFIQKLNSFRDILVTS